MKKTITVLLLVLSLLSIISVHAETSSPNGVIYFQECPAIPDPRSYIDVDLWGKGSIQNSRGPEYSYQTYNYKLNENNRLGELAYPIYYQMLESLGFSLSSTSNGQDVCYGNKKLAFLRVQQEYPDFLSIGIYGGNEKLKPEDIEPIEKEATAEIIPEKYCKDGKQCLIVDKDNVRIYLTGKYRKTNTWILVEVIVDNQTNHNLVIAYTGNVNGWSVTSYLANGFLNQPISVRHSKLIAQIPLDYQEGALQEIGFDTVEELESLQLTFTAMIDKDYGEVYMEADTGLVHLHAK